MGPAAGRQHRCWRMALPPRPRLASYAAPWLVQRLSWCEPAHADEERDGQSDLDERQLPGQVLLAVEKVLVNCDRCCGGSGYQPRNRHCCTVVAHCPPKCHGD